MSWRAISVAGTLDWFAGTGAALSQAKADPFATLKDIPLSPDGSVRLSLGGQLRIRPEFSRQPVFGLAAPAHNNGLLSFLSADLKLGPHLRGFAEFVSGQTSIWSVTSPATQRDRLDFLQAYGELSLPVAGGAVMIRGGRQEMSFGSSRLVSVRENDTAHVADRPERGAARQDLPSRRCHRRRAGRGVAGFRANRRHA